MYAQRLVAMELRSGFTNVMTVTITTVTVATAFAELKKGGDVTEETT